jgi:two-component system, NarL family, response regulator NreC
LSLIQVLIADDHTVVVSGLSMLINAQEDMQVIATASDGYEAYEKVMKLKPDVVIMDLNMPPGENGLVSTARIKQGSPDTKVLILSMHDDREYLLRVLKAGASGYILKRAHDMDVMTAIRTVYMGEAYLDSQVTKVLIQEIINPTVSDNTPYFDNLTTREKEIFFLIAKGYSNKEIAAQLFISVKTVDVHKANIMEKLNLRSRSELVKYAFRMKQLDLKCE